MKPLNLKNVKLILFIWNFNAHKSTVSYFVYIKWNYLAVIKLITYLLISLKCYPKFIKLYPESLYNRYYPKQLIENEMFFCLRKCLIWVDSFCGISILFSKNILNWICRPENPHSNTSSLHLKMFNLSNPITDLNNCNFFRFLSKISGAVLRLRQSVGVLLSGNL